MIFKRRVRRVEPATVEPSPPTTVWVMVTPNGRGYVWPDIAGSVPNTRQKYYHWKATIRHRQMDGAMEAHYLTSEAARGAVEAMLGGGPDDWQAC